MGKIINKVYRLKHKREVKLKGYNEPLRFNNGQEFHIVNDVLYMNGQPVSTGLQLDLLKWVKENPLLFVEDTRKFK